MSHLQSFCYWPCMKEIVNTYVNGCVILCYVCKPTNRKLGLYTPLLVPSHPWESMSMDFVGRFPFLRKGHDYLYVVVDRFSKMFVLMPCKKQITTRQYAQPFFQHVGVHVGLPTSIVSNRDSRFLEGFRTSLWKMMNTKLTSSTKFHPQTNG